MLPAAEGASCTGAVCAPYVGTGRGVAQGGGAGRGRMPCAGRCRGLPPAGFGRVLSEGHCWRAPSAALCRAAESTSARVTRVPCIRYDRVILFVLFDFASVLGFVDWVV